MITVQEIEDSEELFLASLSLPLTTAEPLIELISSLLEDEVISISWEKTKNGWDFSWVFAEPDLGARLRDALTQILGSSFSPEGFKTNAIPDVNWLQESYRQFPAFQIGPFYIFGSHHRDQMSGFPSDLIPLQIDAATAFGSGEHGTTRGCLESLHFLKNHNFTPKNILDMGAGSGILAIGAYKLWQNPVLAIDIDDEATQVAERHRNLNAVPTGQNGMICATGNGYHAPEVMTYGPFDLIIANILAGPLIEMASDLVRNLSSNSYVILSGLLSEQEADVIKAHEAQGLTLHHKIRHGEWSSLILRFLR